MKQTLKKLSSRTGASIIMALVFMLFCLFVGGSVLVAATVNSGRMAGKRQEEQAMLTQRSIASTIVNALKSQMGGKINLRANLPNGANGDAEVSESNAGLKRVMESVFCDCYNKRGKTTESERTVEFTVTIPAGDSKTQTVNCIALWDAGDSAVYVRFKDTPQVRLMFHANVYGNYIQWNRVKILKDVLEEVDTEGGAS